MGLAHLWTSIPTTAWKHSHAYGDDRKFNSGHFHAGKVTTVSHKMGVTFFFHSSDELLTTVHTHFHSFNGCYSIPSDNEHKVAPLKTMGSQNGGDERSVMTMDHADHQSASFSVQLSVRWGVDHCDSKHCLVYGLYLVRRRGEDWEHIHRFCSDSTWSNETAIDSDFLILQ